MYKESREEQEARHQRLIKQMARLEPMQRVCISAPLQKSTPPDGLEGEAMALRASGSELLVKYENGDQAWIHGERIVARQVHAGDIVVADGTGRLLKGTIAKVYSADNANYHEWSKCTALVRVEGVDGEHHERLSALEKTGTFRF